MVRAFLCFVLCSGIANAFAVTPDELRTLSADKSRDDIQRSNRANTGAVDTLLPTSPKQAVSSKYGAQNRNTGADGSSTEPTGTTKRYRNPSTNNSKSAANARSLVAEDSNIYIPPARTGAAGSQIISDAIPATLFFGIRLGTWLPAKLSRDTSSAEPGTVELSISEDVIGDRRTLPAGSILFANKALNGGTKRMEMMVTKGITPSGQEFNLRGIVFDPQKISGLSGIYQVDDKAIAKHGAQKGAVAAIGAAAQTLTGNPLAAAGGAATQSILADTSGAIEYNAPVAVIYVSPQPIIIRVEEKF